MWRLSQEAFKLHLNGTRTVLNVRGGCSDESANLLYLSKFNFYLVQDDIAPMR